MTTTTLHATKKPLFTNRSFKRAEFPPNATDATQELPLRHLRQLRRKRYSRAFTDWKPITELRSVTCHMGSHRVTCHPTETNAPRLNPSLAGRYSMYLPRRDGRLSWPRWKALYGLPSTQSRSTLVCSAAVLRPTQQSDSSRTPRNSTLPACVWTKHPRRYRRHCSCQRSQTARRLPPALPYTVHTTPVA